MTKYKANIPMTEVKYTGEDKMTNADKWAVWLDEEKLKAGYARFTQECKVRRDIPVSFERWVEIQINEHQVEMQTEEMSVGNMLMDLEDAAHHLQEAISNLENVAANDKAGAHYRSHLIENLKLKLGNAGGACSIEGWISEIKSR